MERKLRSSGVPYLFLLENIGEANQRAANSYRLAKKKDDTPEVARSLSTLGWLSVKQGKISEAIDHFAKSEVLFRNIGDNYSELTTAWNISNISYYTNPLSSVEKIENTLKKAEKNHFLNLVGGSAELMENIGKELEDPDLINEGKNKKESAWEKLGWLKVRRYLNSEEPPRYNPDFISLIEGYSQRSKLQKMVDRLEELNIDNIAIAGSLSKGTHRWSSDADLRVITDQNDVKDRIQKIEDGYGFASITTFNTDDFLGRGKHRKKLFPAYISNNFVLLKTDQKFIDASKELIDKMKLKCGEFSFKRFFVRDAASRWRRL